MKQQSNYQDLLKVIALIAMLCDHISLFLLPNEFWLRIIGRFAMPIFAFYVGYNFKGRIRHMIWICGVITLTAWWWLYGYIVPHILIDLAFGQLYLLYAGRAILEREKTFLCHFLGMLVISPVSIILFDYGTITIAYIMVGFMMANRKEDNGHLLLSTVALMLFNMIQFDMDEILPFIFMLIFVALASCLLYLVPHRASIKYNINLVSRNMLYIYFLSTLSLMFSSVYL